MRASIHSALPASQRLDLIAGSICISIAILQYLITGFSLMSALGIALCLVTALMALLSPIYSVRAYQWLCLSPPQPFDPAPLTPQVVVLLDEMMQVRPLLVRDVEGKKVPRFDFERRFYEFSGVCEKGTPSPWLEFELVRFPVDLPLSAYMQRVEEKDTRNAKRLLALYGENKFDVVLPDIAALVQEQARSPFFLFQVGCVLLWMLDEYWYFAVFTLVMLVLFEFVVAQNRRRNIETVRNMLRAPSEVWVKRAGSWRKILSCDLVPLDIVAVSKDVHNPFPCDAILIRGSAVVNEAMLTGESTPKMKDALATLSTSSGSAGEGEEDVNAPLPTSMEESRFVILGGTIVLDSRGADGEEGEDQAVAVVLRTGYETTQGQLMRVILHSTNNRVTVDSNREAYLFMFCLVIVATLAATYVLFEGLKDEKRSQWKLFLHCVMIITSVIPAELPVELSLAVTTSLSNLIQKHAVYCTEPYRIPLAGKVDVCCFDKTGTLTSDDLHVEQIVDARGEDVAGLPRVREILACCQALVVVNREVIGDTTETAAWRFLANRFKILPDGNHLGVSSLFCEENHVQYAVLKRFAFDSNLRRMTVLGQKRGGVDGAQTFVFCKGAPETIETLLAKVPSGYVETYRNLSSKGLRVLALAGKTLTNSNNAMHLTRKEIESTLDFAGFLCLSSPLKVDSEYVVSELKRSGHRVVIITGDSELTAATVGKRLGISEGGVLTGTELAKLTESGDLQALLSEVKTCSVFARVSPNQKEQIIALFSQMNLVTLMVGDGSNDSLSLKRADVGISVVSHPELERIARHEEESIFLGGESQPMRLGDASIASPFTAKTPRVSVVLDIVRQGRCTLVSTIQVFKILAVNGLLHSFSLTFLFLLGVRQGDTQSTVYGLIVAVVFALLSFTQSQETLTPRRPVARIFSPPVIVSVLCQSLLHLTTLYLVTGLVEVDRNVDPDAEFSPNAINTLVYIAGFVLQANVFACNYRGSPFMTSFFENTAFSRMLFLMWAMALVLSLGLTPAFVRSLLELVELPQPVSIRLTLLLLTDTAFCFLAEFVLVRQVLGG